MSNAVPHTPTPWHLSRTGRYVRYSECDDGHVADAPHGANICDLDCFGGPPDERAANAEFIVRAVNCHDELVAALEYIEQFCGTALSKEQAATLGKRASAALAKARPPVKGTT